MDGGSGLAPETGKPARRVIRSACSRSCARHWRAAVPRRLRWTRIDLASGSRPHGRCKGGHKAYAEHGSHGWRCPSRQTLRQSWTGPRHPMECVRFSAALDVRGADGSGRNPRPEPTGGITSIRSGATDGEQETRKPGNQESRNPGNGSHRFLDSWIPQRLRRRSCSCPVPTGPWDRRSARTPRCSRPHRWRSP